MLKRTVNFIVHLVGIRMTENSINLSPKAIYKNNIKSLAKQLIIQEITDSQQNHLLHRSDATSNLLLAGTHMLHTHEFVCTRMNTARKFSRTRMALALEFARTHFSLACEFIL